MTEIRIDADKAERLIAQMLRDDGKLVPVTANGLAASICRRLSASMTTPTNQPLQSYRIIPSSIHFGNDFAEALAKRLPYADFKLALEIWQMVYDRGRDLPPTVADPSNR